MAEESRQRLLERGSSPGQVLVGGIPISPAFLEKKDRTTLMNQFGLSRERFTILFTSGSFGIGPTEAVLDSFKELKDRIQVMVVCGKNESLFDALNRRRFPFVTILFGLVHNMPEIMSVTDLLIAKPGGATTCESLAKRVPMIVLGAIPGQEVHNAEWLLGRRAAFHAKRVEEVRAVVLHILNHPHALAQAREAAARLAKPAAAKALVDFICERKSLQVQEHS